MNDTQTPVTQPTTPFATVESRYADLLQRLGVNGHDGAIREITTLRLYAGLEVANTAEAKDLADELDTGRRAAERFATHLVAMGSARAHIPVSTPQGGVLVTASYVGPMMPPGLDTAVDAAAHVLYEAYCESVGWRAFNGDKLPTWAEFAAHAGKQKQVEAWRAAARAAVQCGMGRVAPEPQKG